MNSLDVTHAVLRRWRAGVRGRIDPRVGIGAGAPAWLQASGLFVSLPFRHAIARLMPSECGTLHPREGGPHVSLSHHIVHHAIAKSAGREGSVLD